MTRKAVEAFTRRYLGNRFLVTCRVRSYQNGTRLFTFTDVTLAPFDEPKIQGFVKCWYQALADLGHDRIQAESRADDLLEAVGRLVELAQNPLLLTTMAVVHTAQVELPRERAKLYQRCVDILLRRWHKHKAGEVPILTQLGLSESSALLSALWDLAYAAHASGEPGKAADLPRSQALKILSKHMGGRLRQGPMFSGARGRTGGPADRAGRY